MDVVGSVRTVAGQVLSTVVAPPARVGGALLGPPAGWLGGRLGLTGARDRRVWADGDHAHIEAHAIDQPRAARVRQGLKDRLETVDGVRWAEVNAVTRRVVVAFDERRVDVGDLVALVESVEDATGVRRQAFPGDAPDHPADAEPIRRALTALAGDVVGLGLAVAGRASGVVRPGWPVDLALLLGLVDSSPRARGRLEGAVGRRPADLGLARVPTTAEGLATGPTGLVVDVVHRADLAWDLVVRRRAWCARERELHTGPDVVAVECPVVGPRPGALPPGPVERVADGTGLAGLAGFGATLAATRDPRRAAGALLTGVPRAARLGREAFATRLGRALAARGAIVLDRRALRRLDRVDTVVIDVEVLEEGGGHELVAAVRRAGHRLVAAGPRRRAAALVDADEVVPRGTRLAAAVRRMQADGAVVAVVSPDDDTALRAADCGIGITRPGRRPPWCAHVLCDADPHHAAFVLEAVATARSVSRRSAAVAVGGSVAGGALALTAPPGQAARLGMLPVNGAALVAMAAANRSARHLDRRCHLAPGDAPEVGAQGAVAALAGG